MVFSSPGSFHCLPQQQQQQQAVPRSRGAIRRRPGALLAAVGSLALAVACVSQQLRAFRLSASGNAFVGLPSAATPAEARKVRLQARGGDEQTITAAEETETDAEVPAVEPAAPLPSESEEVAPLFQEIYISNRSDHKVIRGALVAIFNKGERAADLIVMDSRVKHIPMYAIATMPDQFGVAANVLLRKRDRRLRVRVTQHARPPPDEDGGLPKVYRLPATANATKLASLMKYQFVDNRGNNLKRQVKLEFAGQAAAAAAIMAVEGAMQQTNRELTFAAKFEEMVIQGNKDEDEAEGAEEAEAVPKKESKIIQFGVIVTAT